ncbi:response regulator transcription factor [Microbacterium sp. STN6]|uniref:response regulator transcription factor n=1 Tax=Microbacterium sp. STN6 TaxID=2995588 RepID=UPI0022608B2E|nr:response regulator transcription factor [Microbacterium sp. STN6]MCX7523286.1 response regulator transcription factor [Microbacterium sp. STN6]
MTHELRLAVVEDQPLYRQMLAGLLNTQSGMRVVAEAAGAAEARRRIKPGGADVALLDVELPDGNGVGLGVALRRADPHIGIVLLSSQDVMELLLDLPEDVRRGWSYLSKSSATSVETLLQAIRATARGEVVLDPTLVEAATVRAGSALASLSARQYEVLTLVARGLSNQGVAEQLGLSARSVENHLGAIYAALDLPPAHNSRVAAVLRLIEDTARGTAR